MTENLRACIVILSIGWLTFNLSKKVTAPLKSYNHADHALQRNSWLGLTGLAFIGGTYWLYAAAAAVTLWLGGLRTRNALALYATLLFVIPPFQAAIPGFGILQQLFELTHPRLLALFLLLPLARRVKQAPSSGNFRARVAADSLVLGYLVLQAALALAREENLTNGLRQVWYLLLDVGLPYYVTSRALRDPAQLREVLAAWVTAALLLAAIACFESQRHWLLYYTLPASMGLHWGMGSYLGRAEALRVSASTGHAIALGYVMTVAAVFFGYLWPKLKRRLWSRNIAGALIAGGVVAPLSRGPWMGGLAMLSTYVATGPHALSRLMIMLIGGSAILALLILLPGGEKVIDLLPFIGTVETTNIDYRSRLLEQALIVAQQNLWLGTDTFLQTPEMQTLIQGQGIIDIVNTYLQVLLSTGVIGLILFVGIFLSVGWQIYRALSSLPSRACDDARMGRALLAALAGTMVTIFTTSSITVIPTVYWCLLGLGVAYVRVVHTTLSKGMSAGTAPVTRSSVLSAPTKLPTTAL